MRATFPDGLWKYYARRYDVLLRLQPYRALLREVADSLPLSDGDLCLDAGCGSGNLIGSLASLNGEVTSAPQRRAGGYHVVGVDFSAAMLRRAAGKGLNGQLVLGRLDAPLPFRDEAFDGVACVNVLYALPSPTETLAEFHRVLKAGGRLALVNPKASVSPLRIFAEHLHGLRRWRERLAVLSLAPALLWVGLCNAYLLAGNRRRRWFFPSAPELTSLLADVGFTALNVRETYAQQAWLVSGVRG